MIRLERFEPKNAGDISSLIRRTYDEFVAPDYPPEGNEHFYSFITPEALVERFMKPRHFLITAWEHDLLAGVIAVRDSNHLALMFVDRKFQGRGISRRLVTEVTRIITAETGEREITVFSSPYAVPVYRSLGFLDEGPMQSRDGITFQPMKLTIDKH